MRGLSMICVVLVHIFVVEVTAEGTGTQIPQGWKGWRLDLLSWGIVWVTCFFVASGALSRKTGNVPLVGFWRKRLLRVLVPYYVFVAILVPIEIFLWKAVPDGVCGDFSTKKILTWVMPLHEDCLGLAQGPLWFLQVFLPVALLSPLLARLYDSRFRWAIPVGTLFILGFFDFLWYSERLDQVIEIGADSFDPVVGFLFSFHVQLYWTLVFYFGFFYADGYVQRLGKKLLPLGLGFAALTFVMVRFGVWGGNVFGYTWEGGNQFPPTMAWMSGSFSAWFLIVWARDPIVNWSMRKRVAPVVDWLANRSLTLLIWHMIGYTMVYWVVRFSGLLPNFQDLPTFLERVLWLVLTLPVIVFLVNLFYPLEKTSWFDVKKEKKQEIPVSETPRPASSS